MAEDIVKLCRDKLAEAWEHDRENREQAATDLAFLAGDQWPDTVKQDRTSSRRPMLTLNRLPQFVRQITNDVRQADLAIKVSPVDDGADTKLAEIYNGLLRSIHYQSSAHHVYATAAEHQVSCGMGWFRILTDYSKDSAFDQEIKVRAIPNPMSVYCDPAAVEPDRSDAKWMIVTEMMTAPDFEAQYKGKATESVEISGDPTAHRIFWRTSDGVRVAEFWRRVPYMAKLGLLATGETIELDQIDKSMLAFMPPVVRERDQVRYRVEQYLVSGTDVLDGPVEWPGSYIPIIPVIGAEIPLQERTYRYGAIRFARDAQQLYNYSRTAAAEMIALAPKAPYLVTPRQIENVKGMWDTANVTPRPYLVYNPDPAAPGPPKREHPPETPAALINETQQAVDDMKATTGIHDASLGASSNETSGRAILARQKEGDIANYHFADNLERSLEHAGRVMIELIPKIYDNERVVRLIGEDDSETPVRINQVVPGAIGPDGKPMVINDLSAGRFDVRVNIGPSYSTKRLESADAMMEFMQRVPGAGQIIGDLVAKAMDWPGADEIAKRLKNAVPPELLVDPDAPPEAQMQGGPNGAPPEPDPLEEITTQMQLQGAEAEVREAIAKADKTEIEAALLARQLHAPMAPPEPQGVPAQ